MDYIITHCAPTSIQNPLDLREINARESYLPNKFTDFPDEIKTRSRFRLWFLGRYHGNATLENQFLILPMWRAGIFEAVKI